MADDKKDRIFVGPPSKDGVYPCVRKNKDGVVYSGVVGPPGTVEGKSRVKLSHVQDNEFEIREETRLTEGGPAQVASKAYLSNWGGIFGKKIAVGQA